MIDSGFTPIVTYGLLVLTGLVSYQAFNNPAMKQRLLFHPASISQRGEWYRFLTHGFIHANWSHLLINMFVLWQFGEVIEFFFSSYLFGKALGPVMYLLLYLSAIIVASIPDYFQHKDDFYYGALGASGATSALVFAYILLNPWGWFLFPPMPAIIFGAAYLWYSSYMSKRGADNIAHNAHFWGAVYGLVFMVTSAMAFQPSLLGKFLQALLSPEMPNF